MNKRLTILGSVLAVTIAGAVLTTPRQVKGEFDFQGLNDQVQRHEKQISNLETKTGTLEQRADQTDTTVATHTATLQEHSTAQATPTPTPAPTSQPGYVATCPDGTPAQGSCATPEGPKATVTSVERTYRETNIGPITFCAYRFSDGTIDSKEHPGDVDCPPTP